MKTLKKTTPYIVILGLVLIILYQEGCFGKKNSGDTLNINGKKYEVIKHEIDTFYETKTETRYKKGKDIVHEVEVVKEIPANVDTALILKDLPNLSLYYSTDSENVDNAKILSIDHGIKLAYLADTFAMGKEQLLNLVNAKGVPCPENNKKIHLIDKGGSACVKCSQCVVGRNNILFSATKK